MQTAPLKQLAHTPKMTPLPFIALAIILISSASHAAVCINNSWNFQPNIPGSDLEPTDFDWLKASRFSKQKFGMDLTSITSKKDMAIVAAAASNVLRVDSLSNWGDQRPRSGTEKLKSLSTPAGFALIEDETKFQSFGSMAYCHANFEILDAKTFSVDLYYHIVGLRYGIKEGAPIRTRRLIFIKQDGDWLFDRLGDNSSLPKFK